MKKSKNGSTKQRTHHLFPALRCSMGETIYYTTFLTFRDVAEWIKATDEIHQSKQLSEWIQRQLIRGHADRIAEYLLNQDERFFNAIVIGIYGGRPSWAPLDVSAQPGEDCISDHHREFLEASIGLLRLSGDEKLFAIDGQHRVAGIKEALTRSDVLADDEIIGIFVGHETTAVGQQKTRRLFTTLNKTARRVSDADRVALDEDDGFAVVTRKLIDESPLFAGRELIAFVGSAALPRGSRELTTIINLYQQTRDLYTPSFSSRRVKSRQFGNARPPDEAVEEYYDVCCDYWSTLADQSKEVRSVLDGEIDPCQWRTPRKNYLLMRPIGQRAFAGAVGVLINRGAKLQDAIARLLKVDLWIHKKTWHEILWDPIQKVMLKSSLIAESYLLHQVDEPARTANRQKKLSEILDRRA